MAMNLGPGPGSDEPELMMDINTTPLIDVMLVLLVMLIITIPIQLHAVNMDLPVAAAHAKPVEPEKVQIDIDAQNNLLWQGEPLAVADLDQHLRGLAALPMQPELHIRPHSKARYEVFAKVLAATKRQGLTKVAVVGTEQFARAGGK
jgi:biopolymer transport protein ExbD